MIASRAHSLVRWQKRVLAWFYCSVGGSLMIVSRVLKVHSSKISLLCCNFCGLHRKVSAQNRPWLIAAPTEINSSSHYYWNIYFYNGWSLGVAILGVCIYRSLTNEGPLWNVCPFPSLASIFFLRFELTWKSAHLAQALQRGNFHCLDNVQITLVHSDLH